MPCATGTGGVLVNLTPELFTSKWPSAVVAQKSVSDFSGGIFTGRYVANLRSAGKFPVPSFKLKGGQVAFPALELATWICAQLEPAKPKRGRPRKSAEVL